MKRTLIFFIITIITSFNIYSQTNTTIDSLINLGNDYISINDYDEAMKIFNKALKIDQNYAPTLNAKINLLILSNEYRDAGKLVEKSIEKNSQYAPFYLNLGKYNIHKEKFEQSIEDFNKGIELLDKNTDKFLLNKFFVNKGAAYQKLSESELALKNYTKAIDRNPNNPNVYIYRGYLYYKNGEFEKAITDFSTVIKLDSKNPYAYYNRGMSYTKHDQKNKACKDFHKACEMGNTNACKMVITKCLKL
ncbi:MAG: tetratricopeptide repeat protein [Bacteroidales bacterium]|jgi:tetratricopeptide (TPR) repeat protein|nr:tetratricopeptide repeat protein [Bacteroidales bacterium]